LIERTSNNVDNFCQVFLRVALTFSGSKIPFMNMSDLLGMKPNTYCMLLHLSQLLNFVIPLAGIIVPVVLWAINKDKDSMVDQHGKIVVNWILSLVIYCAVSAILFIVIVGFVLLIVLSILAIIFPIIGGIKANDGIEWKYPLSIPFFK
jgi:uncharacterized Tic20 family protein